MAITSEAIKDLRERTGVSVMECKKALEEAGGDMEKAMAVLSERFAVSAEKKASRETKEGIVEAYVHGNAKVGVLLELLCETDFVAKNPEFRAVAHDIAMHVAAMDPEDSASLLEQDFIKDPSKKISDIIGGAVGKFGENIKLGRFARYSL